MGSIFLSYNREDRVAAEHVARALSALGHSVWWDAGLRTGEAYDEVTEAALREAAAVVVLWTPRSVASRWVRAEATLAQRLGTLFPVMLEAAERPVMFELTQTADLTGWSGSTGDPRWKTFSADLAAFMAERPAPDAARSVSPISTLPSRGFSERVSRRRLWIGGAAAGGVAALAGAGWLVWSRGPREPAALDRSLAVLPFRNLSGSVDQDYFSEGLSAELRAALMRDAALQVAAPASSELVARAQGDARAIAQRLGVSFILQGSVARAGTSIRVAADLVDALAGITRWSETFERAIADVFAVQNEIAGKVAGALVAQISALAETRDAGRGTAGGTRAQTGGTTNVAAFEDFLQGRKAYKLAASEATDRQALAWFDAAIAKDPDYAAAHSSRARTLSALAAQAGDVMALSVQRDEAILAARRAIAIAPDYASGHATLGWVLFNQALDVAGARSAFDRARTLAPGDADVLMATAVFKARTRQFETARTDIARALVLDPVNPSAQRLAGVVSLAAGQAGRALDELARAQALSPGQGVLQAMRGIALGHLGRWGEARDAFNAEPVASFRLMGLAVAEHWLGNIGQARTAFDTLKAEHGNTALYQQAQVLAQWNQPDQALSALEQAYAVRDSGLAALYTDVFLLPLETEVRYQGLLRRMGFV